MEDGSAMWVSILQSKIHRATVTDADLHYEGSISIDRRLMDMADLLPFQQVQIYNIATGARFETYAIEAPEHSGVIQINGAAARLAHPGDLIIIAAYAMLPRAEAAAWTPKVVHVDARNRPASGSLAAA
jgi:aspartate 1-decarboxylase